MNKFIAYCGFDCQKCEIWKATKNNDDKLRKTLAKELKNTGETTLSNDMLFCEGCCSDGVKFPFCDKGCDIKICAESKKYENCKNCENFNDCDKMKMIKNTKN